MGFVIARRQADFDALPKSQQAATLERLREQHRDDATYVALVQARDVTQQNLESDYPQLFVSNEGINQQKKASRQALKEDPDFKQLIKATAAAHHAQQNYLHEHDKLLRELKAKVEASAHTK